MSIVIDRNPNRLRCGPPPCDWDSPRPCNVAPPAARRSFRSLALTPLKSAWRLIKPIRDPLIARFDRRVATVLHAQLSVLSRQIGEFAAQTAETQRQSLAAMRETNLFVDGLVREIAQLQEQVQALSHACAQLAPGRFAAHASDVESPGHAAAGPNRLDCQRTET